MPLELLPGRAVDEAVLTRVKFGAWLASRMAIFFLLSLTERMACPEQSGDPMQKGVHS